MSCIVHTTLHINTRTFYFLKSYNACMFNDYMTNFSGFLVAAVTCPYIPTLDGDQLLYEALDIAYTGSLYSVLHINTNIFILVSSKVEYFLGRYVFPCSPGPVVFLSMACKFLTYLKHVFMAYKGPLNQICTVNLIKLKLFLFAFKLK